MPNGQLGEPVSGGTLGVEGGGDEGFVIVGDGEGLCDGVDVGLFDVGGADVC